MPHDGLVDECLAESFALEDVGEGAGEGDAGLAADADGDGEAFVVEIGLARSAKWTASENVLVTDHDIPHTHAFLSD